MPTYVDQHFHVGQKPPQIATTVGSAVAWSSGLSYPAGSNCCIGYANGDVDEYECVITHVADKRTEPTRAPGIWKLVRHSSGSPTATSPRSFRFETRGAVKADRTLGPNDTPSTAYYWNVNVEYEEGSYCCLMMPEGRVQLFKCLLNHTSSESTNPTLPQSQTFWSVKGRRSSLPSGTPTTESRQDTQVKSRQHDRSLTGPAYFSIPESKSSDIENFIQPGYTFPFPRNQGTGTSGPSFYAQGSNPPVHPLPPGLTQSQGALGSSDQGCYAHSQNPAGHDFPHAHRHQNRNQGARTSGQGFYDPHNVFHAAGGYDPNDLIYPSGSFAVQQQMYPPQGSGSGY